MCPSLLFGRLDIVLLNLPLLAGTLDDVGEVANGEIEWEVERCEHDGEENPPAGHGGDESEGSSSLVGCGQYLHLS